MLLSGFPSAHAFQWRFGAGLGFGGTGLSKQADVGSETVVVDRSEGPGYGVMYVDRPIAQNYSVSIEHARGFRLGPFSAGVGFTGGTLRYFYLTPVQTLAEGDQPSTFTLRQWAPYVGFGTGIAQGTIFREADQVNDITDSGVYIGLKAGADYLLGPRVCLRTELIVSATLSSSSNRPGSMSEFGIVSGVYLPF